MLNNLTPKQIVQELDRFIIGQEEAKKSVAIALRNRWRHQQLTDDIKDEIYPKNLLMIGPTGVGKTEISRRLSKLAKAPFIKVEATKFTEVGYVGRDVEQIVRDLLENAIILVKKEMSKSIYEKAKSEAEKIVLDYIAGDEARQYQPGEFKWRFLGLSIRVYVEDQEDPQEVLALLMEDIERVIDDNDVLTYDDTVSPNLTTTSLTLQSLSTDEGVLAPLGIGEMTLECRY